MVDRLLRPGARSGLGVLLLGTLLVAWGTATAESRAVANTQQLEQALNQAEPGDVIELHPGDYRLNGRINLRSAGTAAEPIVLRARIPGTAVIHSRQTTAIKLFAPHWEIRDLDFRGDRGANHALHIVREADHVVVAGNRFRNFHAAIKANGEGDPRRFPDHVQIRRNVFVNDAIHTTRWPVVAIDIVGGQGWRIEQNFIADIAQGSPGRHGSPGFVKGGAVDALFDRNLVICEWRHTGERRIGLSLGGGGTSPGVLDRRAIGDCETCPESVNSRMTNNIILNCPQEPGLYLNRAEGALVANNTVFNAYGIQGRFPETHATVVDNLITGTIWARDDAELETEGNIATGWLDSAAYVPSLRDELTRRISYYQERYPSWIPERVARWTRATVAGTADWAHDSFLGQRHGPMERWLLAPGLGDLRLNDPDARPLGAGSEPPRVEHDFCGQPRQGRADVGAIQYSAGTCHLPTELERRHGRLFSDL
ncbi:chondroitinase-B domain-containing protein [Thioalkalivibrio sp. ALJT]|uniref:chondroitinase-B domain-containing protein n=1 Tax=Thioalkalivibrio sp. ALJT TaxID=1158146 RepID=UPI0003681749|nr:chondroitinase-B domain-containing protein [Thioalkalivibrio sp. ALJT]